MNLRDVLEEISYNKARAIAIVFALINLYLGFLVRKEEGIYRMFVWDVFVLSFIWFGAVWGRMRSHLLIQRETSGEGMVLLGWILLFSPSMLILAGFVYGKLRNFLHYGTVAK